MSTGAPAFCKFRIVPRKLSHKSYFHQTFILKTDSNSDSKRYMRQVSGGHLANSGSSPGNYHLRPRKEFIRINLRMKCHIWDEEGPHQKQNYLRMLNSSGKLSLNSIYLKYYHLPTISSLNVISENYVRFKKNIISGY